MWKSSSSANPQNRLRQLAFIYWSQELASKYFTSTTHQILSCQKKMNFSRNSRYVLGVESPLVCDILSSADENGLMKMTSMSDFTTTTTTTTSTLNQVKFTLEDAITDVNRKVVDEIDLEQDQAIYDSLELAKDYLDYDEEDEDDEE